MAVVIAALLPVFILIVLGVVLRHSLMRLDTQWHALARLDIDGPAFTSIFQGATRWQTYVALSVSANMFGDVGLALASVAMVAIIPLVNVLSVAVLAHYA